MMVIISKVLKIKAHDCFCLWFPGGAESVPRWRSSAGSHRRHGYQGSSAEEGHSEGGGVRAQDVHAPPAQRPQPGGRLHAV